MSAPKIQAPRGTQDVLPADFPRRQALESTARKILEGAGFERIETPAFESTELFSRGVGTSTDIVQKEMYTFEDGGGRSLTLRPEGTAPIMRAYMEHGMHKLPQPVKLWYWESFFRYERAQAGRYRQFWQLGTEVIGAEDPAVDAELIVLLHAILTEMGVRGVEMRIGSLGSPESRLAYRDQLVAHLHANEDRLSEEVRERIDLNPLRAFDADHAGTREVMASAPVLLDFLGEDDSAHFEEVKALLEIAAVPYVIDATLVRGLDYYARTVFEATSDVLGAQSAVGGGGRYDGLAEQLGGSRIPACGWAAGVERMLLAAEPGPERVAVCDLYVAGTGRLAFAIADQARRAGLNAQVELAGRSLKGMLKQGDRIGAAHVAIVDSEAGSIELKDMETGETEPAESPAAVVARVLKGRHPG